MCEKPEQPRAAGLSLWITPDEDGLVCAYSLCAKCLGRLFSASEPRRVKLNNRVEDNLLKRYPHLHAKLLPFFRYSTN
jgi:hypothetical protein